MLNSVSGIVINPNLNKIVPGFEERYLTDFKEMAKKGFFAFDKTVLSNFSELNYHLVAITGYSVEFIRFGAGNREDDNENEHL